MEKAQVLIVEDDTITAMDIESQLKQLGYGVTAIVGYGEEAIAKVRENKPDVVLMDIVLKGEMDGIEAAEEIRSQFDIPVIFLAAFADKDRLERAKLTYPFGFILKPFQNKDLSVTIEMALYIVKADAERKQAEEGLKKSEEKYRTLFEVESDALFLIDENTGNLLEANEAACKLYGYSPEELVGLKAWNLSAEPEKTKKAIKIVEKTFLPIRYHKKKDGTVFPVEINANAFTLDGRKIIFCAIRDITVRRQAEELLQTEKDKLEIITQNIGAGLCIISKNYRTLWANKVLKQIFGEVEGKVCYETYNQQADVCPNCGVREIFETGKDKVVHEEVGKDADGQIIWSEIIASPIRNKEGDIVSVLELVVPITERKLAEDALRESEERFRDTATMLPSVIIEYDLDGILTYVNPHGYKLAGYEPEDFEEGFHTLRLVAPEEHEKHYERLERMMQGEKLPPTEYRLLRKDGSIFWGLVTSSLIYKDGEVVGVRSYTIDITERKEAEEALKERTREFELQKKSLEELNTAMKVLLKKREEDKTEIKENVMTNVKELIAPYFEKIKKTTLDDHQKAFLNILESNLNEIVSPFTRKLSLKYLSLTPQEIKIVNMIKIGYTTKKIAKIMKISPRTVDTHRKNIRSKIGLDKKKGNLGSHLLAYEQ